VFSGPFAPITPATFDLVEAFSMSVHLIQKGSNAYCSAPIKGVFWRVPTTEY
jgi:hypothetical protein